MTNPVYLLPFAICARFSRQQDNRLPLKVSPNFHV